MHDTNSATSISVANIIALNAIGDAIFAEWYPYHRPGDPVPAHPPLHVEREARELALRHRMTVARRLGPRRA